MEDIILANQQLNKWCGTEGINFYEGDTALGFLFKHAVPKTSHTNLIYHIAGKAEYLAEVWFNDRFGKCFDSNPELALFWVIYEIVKLPPNLEARHGH